MDRSRARAGAELVELAHELVAAGVPRPEAAAELAAVAPDRRSVRCAHLSWVQRMHRLPSDDDNATNVLRVLEAALAALPHPPTFAGAGPR